MILTHDNSSTGEKRRIKFKANKCYLQINLSVILSNLELAHLLPLKDIPQVLQAQALHELTYIHVQHCH